MRLILVLGLTSVSLLAGCAENQPVVEDISTQKSRASVLDTYKNECINEYGFSKQGSDLLAACIQSKDQSRGILKYGSYTFKS